MNRQTRDTETGNKLYLYTVTVVAAIGGLLFGFDTAVISGAIVFMSKQFAMSPLMEGWAVSCALIGCIAGVAFAGTLSDRFGRKKGLILAAALFTISAIGSALPRTMTEFIIARFIGGMGVGIASMLSPVYIAELAPAAIRGRLVAINQLAIIFGMLVTYTVNTFLVDIGVNNWRWMFASEGVPSSLFLIFLLFLPESPRFLAKQGKFDASLNILSKVGGKSHAENEMKEIKYALTQEEGTLAELFQPGLRRALLIGVVLAIFTQVTGINTILYYMPKIFLMAGFEQESTAFIATIPVALMNVIFSVLAILYIDKLGRKGILTIAVSGMFVFLFLLGLAFLIPGFPPVLSVIIVLAYQAFFMFGLGPGFWVLVSEIYPTRSRGRAMSIVTVVLWAATFLVSVTFPSLVASLSKTAAFWIYAFMCILAFAFIRKFVPETKGKTLEEIEMFWRGRENEFKR